MYRPLQQLWRKGVVQVRLKTVCVPQSFTALLFLIAPVRHMVGK